MTATRSTDLTAQIAAYRKVLAEATKECPDCLLVEEGEDDTPLSEGCITKGDARNGTLEIYGCVTCGGSGGGLETDASLEGYPEGVASWNKRMKRAGAEYGTGRVARFPGFQQECTKCAGLGELGRHCQSCQGRRWQVRAGGLEDALAGLASFDRRHWGWQLWNWLQHDGGSATTPEILAEGLRLVIEVAGLDKEPVSPDGLCPVCVGSGKNLAGGRSGGGHVNPIITIPCVGCGGTGKA